MIYDVFIRTSDYEHHNYYLSAYELSKIYMAVHKPNVEFEINGELFFSTEIIELSCVPLRATVVKVNEFK